MYYRELEKNHSVLASHLYIKENIIAKAIYDEKQLSNYYILSFSVFEYEFPIKDDNGDNIKLLSTCWTFYKPKTEVETYFFKNTNGTFYNILFDKQWAEENVLFKNPSHKKSFDAFLDSKIAFYTWLDIAPQSQSLARKMDRIIRSEKKGIFDLQGLRTHSLALVNDFFNHAFTDNRISDNISLSNLDYAKIAKAEKMILLHLNLPFVGVEQIALHVNMSPTKLKSNFKTVFGFSMLQYHKEKNMLLAMQLILNSSAMIHSIASITGYESGSKFAAAFKKRFGKLPSAFRDF